MIKKRRGLFKSGLVLLALGSGLLFSLPAHASFNANNLMDDGIFDNTNTMNAAQIDAFLNTFPSSCISTNRGFTAPEPIGYSPAGPSATLGFTYGSDVSAGTVIYNAAKAYGLNPQVILTTLEKEEGLVTGSGTTSNPGCSNLRYSAAMGYLCTDTVTAHDYSGFELYSLNGTPVKSVTGTCVQKVYFVGFSRQVIWATWTLKKGEQGSEGNVGWNAQLRDFPHTGNVWDNSDDPPSCYRFLMTQGYRARADSTNTNPCPTSTSPPANSVNYYDGLTTIDGVSVHLDTGPTASLYNYTPHFAGNQSFDSIFLQWFGGIYAAPYATGYAGQSGYPQLNPGQEASVYINYQNLGTSTWYDDTSLSTAPAGTYPVRLATSHALNRSSSFNASGWHNTSRPSVNFSAVYLSDGITLTANQHVALPGQIVKYSFNLKVPGGLTANTYSEYFQPIAEGSATGLFNDPGVYLNIAVNPVSDVVWNTQSADPTIVPSASQNFTITFKNYGSIPMYDDKSISSSPAGSYPTHLAISCPINTSSNFVASNWSSTSRPAINFTAVYNSDGTTLAENQHIAQPGQIVKFSFNIKVPNGYSSGTYRLCLQPVLEGTVTGTYADLGSYVNVTVPSGAVINYITPAPSTLSMVSGEQKNFTVQIMNVGNLALPSGSTITTSNGSAFKDSTWISPTILANTSSDLAPEATSSLAIKLLPPTVSSATSDQFIFQINDTANNFISGSSSSSTIQLATPNFTASYAGQSSYPSFTSGQTQTAFFRYKNTGNKSWYDDISVGTATTTRNPLPTRLATALALNRNSGFAYNWPSANRPSLVFSAVYNSDGTSLSTDQHVVQSGQIAEFSFSLAATEVTNPGTYREYFQPIIEGTPDGAINFQWTFLDITLVAPIYQATYYSQSTYPTLVPGQSASAFIEYKNTGNVPWYDDSSFANAPGKKGLLPVRLSTSHQINRVSIFGSAWPSFSRPNLTFSSVYNSDGANLSSSQHVVLPGQIAKFNFTLTVPVLQNIGSYREFFQPIAEGSANGLFNDPWTSLLVTVQ